MKLCKRIEMVSLALQEFECEKQKDWSSGTYHKGIFQKKAMKEKVIEKDSMKKML